MEKLLKLTLKSKNITFRNICAMQMTTLEMQMQLWKHKTIEFMKRSKKVKS